MTPHWNLVESLKQLLEREQKTKKKFESLGLNTSEVDARIALLETDIRKSMLDATQHDLENGSQ